MVGAAGKCNLPSQAGRGKVLAVAVHGSEGFAIEKKLCSLAV